jgi:protein-L-isoaspartate O-methyltransferase
MNNESELAVVRRAYAKLIMATVCIADARVEEAFATVRREDYLGPGPWPILRRLGYVDTPDADPVYVYDDILIGIDPERGLNNGMPSYHAPLICNARVKKGEHVVHVGAGVGYYSAILQYLVGDTGKLTAIEFDTELALRARQNLAKLSNVIVRQGDGCTVSFDAADVVYVNAGAHRGRLRWHVQVVRDYWVHLPQLRSKCCQSRWPCLRSRPLQEERDLRAFSLPWGATPLPLSSWETAETSYGRTCAGDPAH